MRLIDADALIEALRAKEYETVKHPTFLRSEFEEGFSRGINIAKEAIMIAPIVDAIPVDWMVQTMNETSSGSGMNVELNHALFAVSVEWERWKNKHGEDGGEQNETD